MTREPFPHLPEVAARMDALEKLLEGLCAAAQTIFKHLSIALSLGPEERFEDFHNPIDPSSDILRLLKYHKTPTGVDRAASPQTPHTDLGSLTFVFSATPGLQVLPHNSTRGQGQNSILPQASDWAYVAPRSKCAVVNFGDCMTMLTNGLIKSALHKVGPLPGTAMKERYSFAYLMRPRDNTPLRPLQSHLIPSNSPGLSGHPSGALTSGEWMVEKFEALRGRSNQSTDRGARTDAILTGGRNVRT